MTENRKLQLVSTLEDPSIEKVVMFRRKEIAIDSRIQQDRVCFDMTYEDWRKFDNWYKQNRKRLLKKRKYKSAALKSLHKVAEATHAIGAMTDEEKERFDSAALVKGKKEKKTSKTETRSETAPIVQ